MSLDNYVIEAARVMKRLREAVKLFNTIKSHTYYQKLKHYEVRAKRTGITNLNVLVTTIPQTRNPEKLEYLAVVVYISKERVVQRQDFVRRFEYVMRFLKKLMRIDGGSRWHVFIYFIGYAFRSGVYEEAKYTRALFKDKGLDIKLRVIELRYENRDLVSIIYDDLLRYLGSRAHRILSSGNYSRSEGKVFSRPKHLLDFIVAVLMSIKEGSKGLLRIEDLMKEYEENVNTYLKLLSELGYETSARKLRTATESKTQPTPLPTIKYTKQNISEDEEELESGYGEYEEVEDRYERVGEDVEVL